MANLEATLDLQEARADFIEATLADFQASDPPPLGVAAHESQLRLVETYWDKIETTHERIVSSSGKIDGVTSMPYFKNKLFDRALSNYSTTRVMLTQLIGKAGGGNTCISRHASLSTSHQPGSTRRALPEITLPKFSGAYAEWRSFRDLFSSLVGSNPELSNVDRMHYLRTSLVDDPVRLISNLTISEHSFATAWELLTSRYENKRLLVSAHHDRLLCSSMVASHTAAELNQLTTITPEALSALHALGSPTELRDSIVVHLLGRRLSSKLREPWENKVRAPTDYSTLDELTAFLKGRARAMESVEIGSRTNASASRPSTSRARSPPRPAGKVNATTAPRSATIQSTKHSSWPAANRYPCSYCNGEHFIASCHDYRELTARERKEVVDRLYLCFNCLGKHSVRACNTTRTCAKCQERHHTLLRLDATDTRTRSSLQPTTPAPLEVSPVTSATDSTRSQSIEQIQLDRIRQHQLNNEVLSPLRRTSPLSNQLSSSSSRS